MTTLRAIRITGSGTAVAAAKLRAIRITGTGGEAVVLKTIRTQHDVEPNVPITYQADVRQGPPSGITYTHVQLSGPTVVIPAGSGPSKTILPPSVMVGDPDTVVIGVTASAGGVDSPQVTFTFNVLPQTVWSFDGTGLVGGNLR